MEITLVIACYIVVAACFTMIAIKLTKLDNKQYFYCDEELSSDEMMLAGIVGLLWPMTVPLGIFVGSALLFAKLTKKLMERKN